MSQQSDDRDARVARIHSSAREHALVRFSASLLTATDTGFEPRVGLSVKLAERLRALGPSDDLVAAVLGLVQLGHLLGERGGEAAASEIYRALAEAQELVGDALSTLPPDDVTLAAIRAPRFAAFVGDGTAPKVERRAPTEGEVAAGPFARFAAHGLVPKKKDPSAT
jgi:hypothetical protein